jgi:hypothetical protein
MAKPREDFSLLREFSRHFRLEHGGDRVPEGEYSAAFVSWLSKNAPPWQFAQVIDEMAELRRMIQQTSEEEAAAPPGHRAATNPAHGAG